MPLTHTPAMPARHWIGGALLSAMLALAAAPAQAQDATAPAAAPATQAPLPAPTSVPQPEWEKVCGKVKDQEECHVSRRRLAATGQAIAQVMLIDRPDKKLIQIAVPPVALIQPGVQIKIDDKQPIGVKYVVCTPGECLALGEINADFVGSLKRGGKLVISMLNPQGKTVAFDLSLSGFTATYDGPASDPAKLQVARQKLEDELKRKADAARQQLIDQQQQQSSTQ